jgi:hypothetical protein
MLLSLLIHQLLKRLLRLPRLHQFLGLRCQLLRPFRIPLALYL